MAMILEDDEDDFDVELEDDWCRSYAYYVPTVLWYAFHLHYIYMSVVHYT